MYAVKFTNLHTGKASYTPAWDYVDAWNKKRFEDADLEGVDWHYGEDFVSEVIDDLDDDFDFENQPDWN